MAGRKADLALVKKAVLAQGSDEEGALRIMVEGLPHAVPVPAAAGEGAMAAAAHNFQARFVGHIEQCFEQAARRAEEEKGAAEAQIGEAGAELSERRAAAEQASSELEEAAGKVDTKKAHIKELEEAAAKGDTEHSNWEVQGAKKQQEWAELRQLHENAKGVAEGALALLEGEEGDEAARSAAASTATAFLAEPRGINADKVLQCSAPHALAVKPSARTKFDRFATEAATGLIKKQVAELAEQLAGIAPRERVLRAEIGGLWAIADCAHDDAAAAKEELYQAEVAWAKSTRLREEALERVREQEAVAQSHEIAKASVAAKWQQVADASAALERLARPEAASNAEEAVVVVAEEDGEPSPKRQRVLVVEESIV